jgi:putative intracellular protease/amidase
MTIFLSIRREKMRKITLLAIIIILMGVISFPSQVFGESGSKVLMIPREGYSADLDLMIKMEVGVMMELLKKAGFEVDIATTSGFPIIGSTQKIEKILQLADIKLSDYVGIIMPCMAVGAFPGPPVSPEAVSIVKKALLEGKPVAASTNSGIILADAGVLKGKKYAFPRDPLTMNEAWGPMKNPDPRFADAIYSGVEVVQEGKIITSGACPVMAKTGYFKDKTVELTQAFIAAVSSK